MKNEKMAHLRCGGFLILHSAFCILHSAFPMPIGFFKSIIQKFGAKPVDWDELEETLIRADLGVAMTMKILNSLRARAQQITANDVIEVTREEVAKILPFDPPPLRPLPAKPKV